MLSNNTDAAFTSHLSKILGAEFRVEPYGGTRSTAFSKGDLVDVSSLSHTFHVPIALTREVWNLCVAKDHNDTFNQQFRIVSLLTQARIAIRKASAHATETSFTIKPFPRCSSAFMHKKRLRVVVGLDDQQKPVLTVMLNEQEVDHD